MRHIISLSLILVIALVASGSATAADKWTPLADGIGYKKVVFDDPLPEKTIPPSKVHLFKIDPTKFRFEIITAANLGYKNIDAMTMAKKSRALLVINGGFFTPEYAPLGLLMNNGNVLNKMKWTSWWHIFQIKKQVPKVLPKQEFLPEADVEMAIEAGPRLLIDGRVPEKLKPSIAQRTSIGVTDDSMIMIAVTDNYPTTLEKMAAVMKQAGCTEALNLDGGSSTQIYAKIRGFELNVPGFNVVSNGIGVLQR